MPQEHIRRPHTTNGDILAISLVLSFLAVAPFGCSPSPTPALPTATFTTQPRPTDTAPPTTPPSETPISPQAPVVPAPKPTAGKTVTIPASPGPSSPYVKAGANKATPTAGKPSIAPSVTPRPGIYVTSINPATQPKFNEPVVFDVTFWNTMDDSRQLSWLVLIYKERPRLDSDESKKSAGETKKKLNDFIMPGSHTLKSDVWQTGVGRCQYWAKVALTAIDGSGYKQHLTLTDGSEAIFPFSFPCKD